MSATATAELFPDAPMGAHVLPARHWGNIGKPFTLVEKRRFLGLPKDHLMVAWPITKLPPVKNTAPSAAAVAVAKAARRAAIAAECASGCGEPAYQGDTLCAACRDEATRAAQPTYTAVAALACSGCGSHEIDRTGPASGTCAECDAPAEPDPFVVYGPAIPAGCAADRARIAGGSRDCQTCGAFVPRGEMCETCFRAGQYFADGEPAKTPCPRCGTPADEGDRFCVECGLRLAPEQPYAGAEAPSREELYAEPEPAPAATPDVETWPGFVPIRSKYRGQNPARILSAMPHATDVRGFHDWIKHGRVVRKGQHGIQIYTPAGGPGEDADGTVDERRPRVKRAWVFDISQTDVLTPKEKKERPAAPEPGFTPFPPATHTPPPARLPALRAADI